MILAILFPCLYFFLRGHILLGIVCLLLQCTLIGWIPAAILAAKAYKKYPFTVRFFFKPDTSIIITVLFPWFYFFVRGNILFGFICLALQCSIIGWVPAAVLAIMAREEHITTRYYSTITEIL